MYMRKMINEYDFVTEQNRPQNDHTLNIAENSVRAGENENKESESQQTHTHTKNKIGIHRTKTINTISFKTHQHR